MSGAEEFWNAIPGPEALNSEANVEQRLVLPLLEALGYDRTVDIESKYRVEFQQGRAGRKHEADIVCFYGPLRDKRNSLLVVETKAADAALSPGKAQGESYAQNLRAPLLLLTNGRDLEIWQLQITRESECVLQISVCKLAESRGQIERLLNKTAVRDYCKALEFKNIIEATTDFGKYETAELKRLMREPLAIGRSLTLKGASEQKPRLDSHKLLVSYPRGAIVLGQSGFGKTTLSRGIVKQAIEERWRGNHIPVAIEAPLPDMEASGGSLLEFLHQRLEAHLPGVKEASFRDLLRNYGVTVIVVMRPANSAALMQNNYRFAI